jgi:NifU-like protein involved in Fe-S cluster formation
MDSIFSQIYSEKVLEHVRHPRNLGEIKNADAVATVGNRRCGDVMRLYLKVKNNRIADIKFQTLGCLPYNEEIVIPSGHWMAIGSLQEKMEVLNGEKESSIIIKKFKKDYNGKLLTIIPFVSPFNAFTVTPNHPIFTIKRDSLKKTRKSSHKCDLLRVDEREFTDKSPEYVQAKALKIGDYLIFPFKKEKKDKKIFTDNLMKLLGYYLAEGYITAGSVVNFSFNRNERKYIDEVSSLVFEITGKKTSERTRENVTEIRFCSKKWADFFYLHCCRLARKKNLSKLILQLPFKKQWIMVRTFLAGDGDVYKRRPNNSETYRAITASKLLAIQIQEILARGGIFASIRKIFKTNCFIDGRRLKDSIQYLISFKLKRNHKFVHENEKYFLVPIREIRNRNFSGKVYNFQVAFEPNSYLVRGFAVHNCGAAIATSSIITTMVKGKPLSEAEKITDQAIVTALGGLPPAKLHCSLLATDALKKAIANYRKRLKKS